MSNSEWERIKFSIRDSLRKLEGLVKDMTHLNLQASQSANLSPEGILMQSADDLRVDFERAASSCEAQLRSGVGLVSNMDPARMAQLMRFREQLAQLKRDWERQRATFDITANRTHLMGTSRLQKEGIGAESSALLNERSSLMHSMGMIDSTIENAAAADAMIREQNVTLIQFTGRIGSIAAKIPFVNSLLSRINSRQMQERIILSLVVGVCISIFIWMRMLR